MKNQIIAMIAIAWLIILLAIGVNSYTGRQALVTSQRAGCERGIPSRINQIAVAWTEVTSNRIAAQLIPRQMLSGSTKEALLSRELVAARLAEAVQQHQLALDESILIPSSDAHLLPKPLRYLATYSCTKVYPEPGLLP